MLCTYTVDETNCIQAGHFDTLPRERHKMKIYLWRSKSPAADVSVGVYQRWSPEARGFQFLLSNSWDNCLPHKNAITVKYCDSILSTRHEWEVKTY